MEMILYQQKLSQNMSNVEEFKDDDPGWIQCQRSIQYPFEWEQFDCYLLKVKFQIPSLSETSYGLGPKIAKKKRKSESIAILINLSRGTYCNVCAILQYWSPSQQNSYLAHFVNPTCFTSEIVNPTSVIVNPTCFTSVIVYGCDIGVSMNRSWNSESKTNVEK